jgi:hypothetical protein
MDPAAAKQQIAERVKQANKFLVTVNANPTVDQLAACIGLTLLLNKMGKHATAVFSGKVPSTIEFLQPGKTFETNTNSLRDFIISLDKSKADKLRYKVENDVVRIFITPYKTSLSQKDLVFSEGDVNVEAVIALGVTQQGQLDAAITAHGRILHDASVISVNTGQAASSLGQINWADPQASSLCEMLVSISEAFGPGLIDAQTATAFLTGIVAETQRFSNKKTSPKVMTMSAQLMAAGANQQLIVSKLEPPPPPPPPRPKNPPAEPPKPPEPKPPKEPPRKPEGIIDVPHDNKPENQDVELGTTEIRIDEQGNLITSDQMADTAKQEHAIQEPAPEPMVPEPPAPEPPAPVPPEPEQATPSITPLPPPQPVPPPPIPTIKAETKPKLDEPESNHAFIGSTAQPPGMNIPFSASTDQPDWAAPYDLVPMDPLREAGGTPAEASALTSSSYGHTVQPPLNVQPVDGSVDNARSAVASAFGSAPSDQTILPPEPMPSPAPASVEPLLPPHTLPVPTGPPDTPVFTLPIGDSPAPAPQPAPTPVPDSPEMPAPPPMPPPLVTAPGAVIPNPPQSE